MNLEKLHKKLIAAARTDVPDDRVPLAFEKRISALLASRVAPDSVTLWVRGLWRAAVSCAAISMLMSAWALFNPAASSATDDLSQSFETTLLASVDLNDQAP